MKLSENFVLRHVTKFAYKDKYNKRKGYQQVTLYPTNQYIQDGVSELKNINIYFKSYLSIDSVDPNILWEKRESIMITDYTIHKFIKALKKVKKWFKSKKYDDLYYLESGVLTLNKEMAIDLQEIVAFEYDKMIKIVPVVINDRTKLYEGVLIFVNNERNFFELSINEIKTLHYKLKKINLYEAGLSMLNFLGKDNETTQNDIRQINSISNYNTKQSESNLRNKSDNNLKNEMGGWFK
jgi:hypothetical protein